MQKKSYMKNAAILTATGLLLRVAGMFFRVYIAARIGAAGMGLYQLIYTVYTMAVTFATAGLSVVATRVTSGMLAKQQENGMRHAMQRMLWLSILLSAVSALALYFAAAPAAQYWIRDARATLSLQILAPSLPFMALSAILRGWFMAYRQVAPNARGQIYEQIIRIALVMALLPFALPYGVTAACAAVVFGNTVSEICSWAYLQLCYRKALKMVPKGEASEISLPYLVQFLAPIAAGQYVMSVLRTFENVLVPNMLALFLQSRDAALEQFGALRGMAMPVLFFPFSFLSTLATLLVPDITEAYVRKETSLLRRLVSRVLLLTITISMLASVLYVVFARDIGNLLYHSSEIGFYIGMLGPLMPFMYLESMVDGILKGLDQQVASFRYTLIDCTMRIALIWLLLPRFGMQGFLFVMLVSNLLTSLLNLRKLLSVTQLPFDWKQWLLKPVFSAVCGALVYLFVLVPLCGALPQLWLTILGMLVVSASYFIFLGLCGGVKLSDFYQKKKAVPAKTKST